MIDLFREIQRRRARGDALALATVVDTRGSTPREAGAKMLVPTGDSTMGTIGGGFPEHEVHKVALEVIRTGRARLVHLELTADVAAREGATCGGIMDVLVELIR